MREFVERYRARIEALRQGDGGVLRAGASEAALAEAERRLGCALPGSYREFLLTTNGCEEFGLEIGPFLSAEELNWRVDEEVEFSRSVYYPVGQGVSWEDHLVYGDAQTSVMFRADALRGALWIGGGISSYWLSPLVKTPAAEWEAWHVAHWHPGARRYRSFREMLEELLADEEASSPEASSPNSLSPNSLSPNSLSPNSLSPRPLCLFRVRCIDNRPYLNAQKEPIEFEPQEGAMTDLVLGKVYPVYRVEHGMYRIIDESGEDYLYPKYMFERLEG
ncbi:MAG: SMI1/KNR4 family protein [Polyangiaceae bacterium]